MTRKTISRMAAPLVLFLALGSTAIAAQMNSGTEGTLPVDMRKLWDDHVSWTRMYIISATANAPDKGATLDRLMKNQDDIGNAIKPFYGDSAGRKLTELLKDHIRIAGEVVDAATKADKPRVEDASRRWGLNADQLAMFLAGANPTHWKVDELKQMLHQHLDLTTREVTTHLAKDWKGSIDAYDKVRDQALMMADALSGGIMKQFPQKAAM